MSEPGSGPPAYSLLTPQCAPTTNRRKARVMSRRAAVPLAAMAWCEAAPRRFDQPRVAGPPLARRCWRRGRRAGRGLQGGEAGEFHAERLGDLVGDVDVRGGLPVGDGDRCAAAMQRELRGLFARTSPPGGGSSRSAASGPFRPDPAGAPGGVGGLSSEGYPQDPPYSWLRLYDEYDDAV